MAILKPEHLFDQAEKLAASPAAGAPRQVDLRRAVSAAYYAIFHATLTAAADEYVGAINQKTKRYGLVYRSIDHKWLRTVCSEAQKPTPSERFRPYVPANGFSPNIIAFSAAVVELQEKRHTADYDPLVRIARSDAILAISTGRAALQRFQSADTDDRNTFLTLLLFEPRA